MIFRVVICNFEQHCALCLKERNLVEISRIPDLMISDMGEVLNFCLPLITRMLMKEPPAIL